MMSSPFRLVPPAGAPLRIRDVARAARRGRPGRPRLADALRERVGVAAFALSSGRAALSLTFQILRRTSDRPEVVIPAYTCFSVPSAVAHAGLRIRLCDVDPKTLDLDPKALARLDLSRVLCIVPSGLYGLPADLEELERVARVSGVFLIDDAAQCLGATVNGRPCGTFGDAGIYSLGRGKGITTMGGGILVTRRPELARSLERELDALTRPSLPTTCVLAGASLVYASLLRPSRYWLVDRLPFLDLGASRFEPDFPIARLSDYQQRLATELWPLVHAYNDIRRRLAGRLRAGIEHVEGIEIPQCVAGAHPVYLRFPILTKDGASRETLLRRLRRAGIGASPSYPTSVADIAGIAPHLAPDDERIVPGARSVASRILTLPTHPGVTARDIDRMIAIIADHACSARHRLTAVGAELA